LIQCNSYQHATVLFTSKNRTHECEKLDPDGEYKYFIVTMKTRYSKRDFLCGFFLKSEDASVELSVMLSHANFIVTSVSEFLYSFLLLLYL
jgi:hypothetical protein